MPPHTEAQIAHHIPGRLRLIVPGLRENPALAERLSRELGEVKEVVAVAVRPAARSVLVRYEPNGRNGIQQSLADVVRIREAPPTRPVTPAARGTIGEMAAAYTHERWDQLNAGLKRATDGAVDLATVVPLFLLFLAVRQVMTQPNLAALPWYTALYYSFQSFNRYYGHPPPSGAKEKARLEEEEEEMGPE